MKEIWKPVSGFENSHEVSNMGNVRHKLSGKLLSPFTDARGDQRLNLYHKGKLKSHVLIKILVAEQFVDNPYNLVRVRHIDGDKTNNICDNLEYTISNNSLILTESEANVMIDMIHDKNLKHICKLYFVDHMPIECIAYEVNCCERQIRRHLNSAKNLIIKQLLREHVQNHVENASFCDDKKRKLKSCDGCYNRDCPLINR